MTSDNDGNQWPTYPGPDFRPGPSGGQGAPQWPAQGSPQWAPGGSVGYGNTPPRPGNGAKVAVMVAVGVVVLMLITIGGFTLFSAGSGTIVAPTPDVSASTEADPHETTNVPPVDPIPPAPAGQPAEGELKERIDQAYGTFQPIQRSGTANDTIELPPEAAKGVIAATSDGAGWFEVNALFDDGTEMTLFYSGAPYDGVSPYGFEARAGKRITSLSVESRGAAWSLNVRPVSSVPVLTDRATGQGHAVLIHDGAGTSITLDYRGDANFIARQFVGDRTEHLANEIGDSTVTGRLEPGLSVIDIEAWTQGAWGAATS